MLSGLTAGTQVLLQGDVCGRGGQLGDRTCNSSPAYHGCAGGEDRRRYAMTADFAAGTLAAGAYVSETTDGEVILTPTVGAEFGGTVLPDGWTSTPWATGGASTVAKGVLTADGARTQTDALFGPGASLEFVATFGTDGFQHVGFGVTLDAAPWAIFSTRDGGALYARTNTAATSTDTPLPGNWLSAPHLYRIDWSASSVSFFIDGALVATHPVAIADTMRPIVSDAQVAGQSVAVDWIRLTPYAGSGTLTSRVLDAGSSVAWKSAAWTAQTPTGTTIALSARFGNTPTPDGTWTAFAGIASSGAALSQTSRYVQYSAVLSTSSPGVTPALQDVTFSAAAAAGTPAISIADRSITEGNAGVTNAVITLTLSTTSTSSVTVNYATAPGTATAGTDYTTTSGTATFAPGTTTTTITVPIIGDTVIEPDETVLVNLTAPVNATIADAQAVITITNDDGNTPSLPSPWVTQDIGAVGLTGSASYAAATTTFTVTGAGADIWGTADAFRYAYQPLTGDGQIIVRVATVQNTNVWVKAGVMIRGGVSAGAAQGMMMVTPGTTKGNNFQRRLTANGVSTGTTGAFTGAPRWVKLTRSGNLVTAYESPDGDTWTLVGSDTIALPATALVGLAVSSHSTTTLASATFDNVTVGPLSTTRRRSRLPTGPSPRGMPG